MRFQSSSIKLTEASNVRSRSYIRKAQGRKKERRQIMWPYTDEELDFINGSPNSK